MRQFDSHADHDDPDRTDELPLLDPVPYEAQLQPRDSGDSDSTDTWLVPQPLELHAARITQLESELAGRETELHSLRDDLKLANKKRLDGELAGILDKIAHLETRLEEARLANADLEARCKALESERDDLNARNERLETDVAALTDERLVRNAQVSELEQTLFTEREASRRRVDDLDSRLMLETGAFQSTRAELTALQTELHQARTDLATALAHSATLDDRLIEQTAAAEDIAHRFAQQYALANDLKAALDVTHAAIGRLDQTLGLRENRIESLEDEAELADEQVASLERELITRERAIAALHRDVAGRDARISELNERIAAQTAAVAALEAEKVTLQQTIAADKAALARDQAEFSVRDSALAQAEQALGREQAAALQLRKDLELRTLALEESDRALGLATRALTEAAGMREKLEADASRLGHDLGRLDADHKERLQALEDNAATLALKEQALATAIGDHEQLVAQHGELKVRCALLEKALAERAEAATRQGFTVQGLQERQVELENRLTLSDRSRVERDATVAALEAELTALRQASQAMVTDLRETQARAESLATDLEARNATVANLQTELDAHIEALGAIRRDINRVESGRPDVGSTPMRYLIAVDEEDIVHVLNRKVMTIGRTEENDLQVPSSHISRHHARLLVGPGAVILEDLDSTNGCYVNGRRIKRQLLQNEDVLMIGKTRFRFTSRGASQNPH